MTAPRVLVCGGRDFTDAQRVFEVLDHYLIEARGFAVVIHGAAKGADMLAAAWAKFRDVPAEPYPILPHDWTIHGKSAGPLRNKQMLQVGRPDVVIAFPGGNGTANMIWQAEQARVPVLRIPRELLPHARNL